MLAKVPRMLESTHAETLAHDDTELLNIDLNTEEPRGVRCEFLTCADR